jgi:hypothetical protein
MRRLQADTVRRPQPGELGLHLAHGGLQVLVQKDGEPAEDRVPVAEVALLGRPRCRAKLERQGLFPPRRFLLLHQPLGNDLT